MAAPSKFDMGGMPRTKTGLVPTSYRQQMEDLSTPEKWGALPVKPKLELYPYRGDYVNERNRKIRRERKLAKKNQRPLNINSSRSDSDSCSTSLLVTPRSSINPSTSGGSSKSNKSTEREAPSSAPDDRKKWDSYCKHISCNKLSADEECARTQNKNKYVSYLRSEACKRPERKKNKENEQNDAENVRKRKPPVPRLSRLARSGAQRANQRHGQRSLSRKTSKGPRTPKKTEQKESQKAGAEKAQTKIRYLDFISKRVDRPPKPSPEANVTFDDVAGLSILNENHSLDEKESSTRSHSDEEDDDSRFRSQIERIVQRAASMVLEEQRRTQMSPKSLDIDVTAREHGIGSSIRTSDNRQSSLEKNEHDPETSHTATKYCQNSLASPTCTNGSRSSPCGQGVEQSETAHREDMFHRQNELAILEDRVKSMSSSASEENGVRSSSPASFENTTFSLGTSSLTEVMTREPVRQQGFGGYKSIQDLLHAIESSSFATSFLGETESSSEISDVRTSDGMSCTSSWRRDEINELAILGARTSIDAASKVRPQMPHYSDKSISRQPTLAACPEETVPSPVGPLIEPFTEVMWEEEPLPRGYEHASQTQLAQRNETDDCVLPMIAQGECNQHKKPELMVDDMFSLFG